MRELRRYAEPALKIICLLLAVLVVLELAGVFSRWNPFRGVNVPELPSLAASTNSPDGRRARDKSGNVCVQQRNQRHITSGRHQHCAVGAGCENKFQFAGNDG